jgi:hypothetical protein
MNAYRRHTPPAAERELARLEAALELYRRRTEEIGRDLGVAVGACIKAGATWGEVGRRLGMTKQGAREHWAGFVTELPAGETAGQPPAESPPAPE